MKYETVHPGVYSKKLYFLKEIMSLQIKNFHFNCRMSRASSSDLEEEEVDDDDDDNNNNNSYNVFF